MFAIYKYLAHLHLIQEQICGLNYGVPYQLDVLHTHPEILDVSCRLS